MILSMAILLIVVIICSEEIVIRTAKNLKIATLNNSSSARTYLIRPPFLDL